MAMRTAHDVRRLCVCNICGSIGDERAMVRPRGAHFEKFFRKDYDLDVLWHPGCFTVKFGEEAVFNLSRDERRKIRLCDVSADVMRRLIDDL